MQHSTTHGGDRRVASEIIVVLYSIRLSAVVMCVTRAGFRSDGEIVPTKCLPCR
jgi:hypothetical protein